MSLDRWCLTPSEPGLAGGEWPLLLSVKKSCDKDCRCLICVPRKSVNTFRVTFYLEVGKEVSTVVSDLKIEMLDIVYWRPDGSPLRVEFYGNSCILPRGSTCKRIDLLVTSNCNFRKTELKDLVGSKLKEFTPVGCDDPICQIDYPVGKDEHQTDVNFALWLMHHIRLSFGKPIDGECENVGSLFDFMKLCYEFDESQEW